MRCLLIVLLCVLLLATAQRVYARAEWDTLWITPTDPSPDFTANQGLLYDSLGRLDILQVSQPGFSPRFKFVERYWRDDGLVPEIDVYWSRMVVINQHWRSDYVLRLAEVLDTVTLYVPKPEGGFAAYTSGRRFPLWMRPIQKAQGFALPLYIAPNDTLVVYLRCVKTTNYFANIGGIAGIIDSTESLFNEWTRLRFRMGLFLGMLFVSVLIALIYYALLHVRQYPSYVLDALFTLLFAFDNMELYVEFGLPSFPGLSWLIRVLMFGFRMHFALSFLEVKDSHKETYSLIVVCWAIASLLGVSNIFHLDIYREGLSLFAYALPFFMLHIVAFWQLADAARRTRAICFLLANALFDASVFFTLFDGNFNTLTTQNLYYVSLLGESVRIVVLAMGIAHLVRRRELQTLTQKHQSELELQKAIHAAELQKKHIARELHDRIGFHLTRILYTLENNNTNMQQSNTLTAYTTEAIGELREAIWAVSKDHIRLEDLLERITNLLDKTISGQETLDYVCRIAQPVPVRSFNPVESLNIYFIFQEALQNVLKHSGADLINFEVEGIEGGKLCFSLSDNGKGLPSQATEGRGFANMRARAAEIGAVLHIEAKNGVSIQLTIKD